VLRRLLVYVHVLLLHAPRIPTVVGRADAAAAAAASKQHRGPHCRGATSQSTSSVVLRSSPWVKQKVGRFRLGLARGQQQPITRSGRAHAHVPYFGGASAIARTAVFDTASDKTDDGVSQSGQAEVDLQLGHVYSLLPSVAAALNMVEQDRHAALASKGR